MCEKEEDAGYFKLMYCNHHKLQGATIVCQRAGELINELALCMHQGIKVRELLIMKALMLVEGLTLTPRPLTQRR